ncbi:MAG: crossover junction endodeoxyribonuclease RuvC [Syntrophomonadaceae bacterium]|nr:crossover junction endodeoxyribonuclease RuvC [Syntrophomonadaceae bacterium]
MLVLGFDPGTALTGYGLVSKDGSRLTPVNYGVIRTSAKTDFAARLVQIYQEAGEIIARFQPQTVVVEEVFFNNNAKTFSTVSQARGALILAAALSGIEVAEYTPLQVKQAVVGYGQAEKQQVQKMVKSILKMDDIVRPDDAADALAIAICHIHSCRGDRFR